MHYLYNVSDLLFQFKKNSNNLSLAGSVVPARIARPIVTLGLIFLFMLSSYGENTRTIRHTADSGYWLDPNTWEDRIIPQPGEHAWILEEHEVLMDDFARIHSLTIEDGGTLVVLDEQILVIENQGVFTNHGTFNAGNGRVEFANEAATAGTSEIVFHDVGIVGADVQFETAITFVSGTLHLITGSVASAPVYLEESVLRYATGGNYTREMEWNEPWHVHVSEETTLLLNLSGYYLNDLVVRGNLTIDLASSVIINNPVNHVDFSVLGDILIDGQIEGQPGAFEDNSLSDFFAGGEWNSTNGQFVANGIKVIFNGSQPQSFQGASNHFAGLIIDQGSELVLQSDLSIANMKVRTGAILTMQDFRIMESSEDSEDDSEDWGGDWYGYARFYLQEGATIRTSHPGGLAYVDEGCMGIINPTLSVNATYHYTGITHQVSGDLLPVEDNNEGAKNIIIELAGDELEFRFNTSPVFFIEEPGSLEIRSGSLITPYPWNGFAYRIEGSGALIKSGGVFRIEEAMGTQPFLTGDYTITGGTLELIGVETAFHFWQIRSQRTYYNIVISGETTDDLPLNIGPIEVLNRLEFEDDIRVIDYGIDGPGDLVMPIGRLVINRGGGHDVIVPGLAGDYFLTGGTIVLENPWDDHIVRRIMRGGRTYYNLEVNSSFLHETRSNLRIASDIAIVGVMNVNYPARLEILGESQITGPGRFNLNAGATLRYESAFGITHTGVRGNVIAGLRFFSGMARYEVSGSSDMVTGNGLPTQVQSFAVMLQNHQDAVTLSQNLTINEQLILNNGLLTTDDRNLFLANPNPSAIGGQNSWINGPFTRAVSENTSTSGNLLYFFPVGTETYRSFAGIMFYEDQLQTNDEATLTVSFENTANTQNYLGNLPEEIDGVIINTLADEGFWSVEPEGVSDAVYSVSFRAGGFSGINDPATIRILKRNDRNDDWQMAGNDFSYGNAEGDYFFLQQNVNGFLEFALGSNFSQNPLPVEWLAFDATPKDQKVLLTWQTATETNNSHFTVLHSTDGLNLRELGQKQGAGNSNQVLSYSFTDPDPEPGVNYYRIRQTDFDGTTDYSNLVAVDLTLSKEPGIFCHNQTIHFSLPRRQNNAWSYQIYLTDGGLVHSGKLPHGYDANPYKWDAALYAGQILLVRLTNHQESFARKIVVR